MFVRTIAVIAVSAVAIAVPVSCGAPRTSTVEQERRNNGRWFVIGLVSFMALVVAWAAYLLFVVGQKAP
jgi:hypothetical protein